MTKLYSIKGLQAFLICLSLLVSPSIQAQVPSYVPTDGLVGYWPFNGNANDESGNGNNGTVNGTTLTEDRFGNNNAAYYFNNSSSILIPNSASLNGIAYISFNAFINSTGFGADEDYIISRWNNSNDRYWGFRANQNGQAFVHPWAEFSTTSGYSTCGMANSSSALVTGQNIMLTCTYDGLSQKFYINGVYQFGCPLQGPLIETSENILFGYDGYAGYFNGTIDDIGIWNRALTDEEILELYNGCDILSSIIAGDLTPYTFNSSDYSCNNNPGSTYEWTITNGVITAGQGTSNVTVLWGEEGAGTLTVVETNTEGCSGTPATIEVTIECATTATTLDGPLGPNALTETTYTCNGSANSTFEWAISNGVITSGQGTNSVTVLWAATGLGSISVQETTNANCIGDLISINVVVIPTSIDELNESNLFLYPNPAKEEITLQTNQSSIGSLYIIVDQTGKQIATGKITGTNTTIKLDQFASGMYTIIRDGKTSQQFQVIK